MTAQTTALTDITILRLPEVLARTGLGKSTLYAMVAANEFPPPVQLAARRTGWRSDAVARWIESRPSARSAAG